MLILRGKRDLNRKLENKSYLRNHLTRSVKTYVKVNRKNVIVSHFTNSYDVR
jgi:hypothetical protein